MTRDTWHVTHNTWHLTLGGSWTFSQNFILSGIEGFLKIGRKRINEWMNKLINDGGVCRTAPATPGPLTRQGSLNSNRSILCLLQPFIKSPPLPTHHFELPNMFNQTCYFRIFWNLGSTYREKIFKSLSLITLTV